MEVVVTVALWLLCGVGVAVVMARRGYSLLKWLPIGIAFGPVSIAFALGVRSDTLHREKSHRHLRLGEPGQGPLTVVVGIDGSAASQEALRTVTDLLGPRLGRLTLATVSSLDTGVDEDTSTAEEARARLEAAADAVRPVRPTLVVLSGPPGTTLAEYARHEAADLLVVGSRGSGFSRRLVGSVAQRLAGEADPPVLIVSVPRHPEASRSGDSQRSTGEPFDAESGLDPTRDQRPDPR